VSPNAELTPRELQVLDLVLRGLNNKQIAAELGVAEQGIKEHVSTLFAKFAVPNRAALAEAGMRLELTGERGIDRAWVRELFRGAEPQICILRGPELRYEAVNDALHARRAIVWPWDGPCARPSPSCKVKACSSASNAYTRAVSR
jgi:DNA-binding CsgD family transcriptional regulator